MLTEEGVAFVTSRGGFMSRIARLAAGRMTQHAPVICLE
jgi:hypothetical protein